MSTETLSSKQSTAGHNGKSSQPTPEHIMQIGMGFWASKTLLAAVHFRLFTLLSGKKLSGADIKDNLDLKTTQRHVYDFLDTLVSLGFLEREGLLDKAKYSNTADTDIFLDENKPSYIGGILKMGNNRLYRFWGDLEEGLLSGQPQNESKGKAEGGIFDELYKDPVRLQEFMDAMSGIQTGNFMTLVKKFNFNKYKTLLDVGGADGWLSIQVCRQHPDIKCINYDLAPVKPLAEKKIAQLGLSGRIKAESGDFFKDPIPRADVITMGNIIHGMDENAKQSVIDKVYQSLNDGGALIVIENIIDNDRRQNTFGLLMSLNMLIENGDAFDYSMNDFEGWAKKAGFKRTELIPLTGPASAAIAYKS